MEAILLLISLTVALVEPAVTYFPPANSPGSQGFSHTTAFGRPGQQYGTPHWQHGGGGGGYNVHEHRPSTPANYHFQYHVQDARYGNDFGHQETRQGDVSRGRYFVLLPNGSRQIVDYIADKNGYRPKVSYKGPAPNFGGGKGGHPRPGSYGNDGGYAGTGGHAGTGAGGYFAGGGTDGSSSNGGYYH